MKKKVIYLSLCFVILIITLTGCKAKTALSVDEFNSIVKKQDLAVEEDAENLVSENENLKNMSKATYSDDWDVYYYVFDNEDSAKTEYAKVKNKIMTYKKSSISSILENNIANYNFYQITGGGHFAYVCRVDNTVLYFDISAQYKEDAKNLIKELGY